MRDNALQRILQDVTAFIFDLDGVITRTASVHAKAWKQMFDEYLKELNERTGTDYSPFDISRDYSQYVDGKPRYDGVQRFLESRNIELPYGSPDDSPEQETICGLGNRKNEFFLQYLQEGVTVYDSTVSLIQRMKDKGIQIAVVSSSKNCPAVLEAAGLTHLFDTRVDGQVSAELKLTGKPAPDIFLEAAKRLGVKPEESCVIEDAVSGVEAGSRGEFRYVIGVDRLNQADRLREHGADMVVNDLVDLERKQLTSWLPSAPERVKEVLERLTDRQRAFFLDYDGTLTPIVERPEQAVLSEEMRQTLTQLASTETVAIVSGRDLQDVRDRVNIENLFYAGSHGFDILGPDGVKFEHDRATDALPALDKAESALRKRLQGISGAEVERKRFSIAVHYRRVGETEVPLVADAVKQVGEGHTVLRTGTGKKVFELQPDVDWNKGKALLWMINTLGLKPDRSLAVYIGDDTTDEDAFEVLAGDGIGIVVHSGSPKLTFAEYVLADTEEVRQLLEQLSKRLKGDRS